MSLDRFHQAQDDPRRGLALALAELQAGRKRSHWIWYIFPQLEGLGVSEQARFFALRGEAEAAAYLRDATLRAGLFAAARLVADHSRGPHPEPLAALMGSEIDAKKLVSSLTLFREVAQLLRGAESEAQYGPLADLAADILAMAERQGYPPCAYTLRRLRATSA